MHSAFKICKMNKTQLNNKMLIRLIKNISKIVKSKKIDGFSINNKCIKIVKNGIHYQFKSTHKEVLLSNIDRFQIDPLNLIAKIQRIEKAYVLKSSDFIIEVVIGEFKNTNYISFAIFKNKSILFINMVPLNVEGLPKFMNSCMENYVFYQQQEKQVIDSFIREMPVLINEVIGTLFVMNEKIQIMNIHHEIRENEYSGLVSSYSNQKAIKKFFSYEQNLFMPTESMPSNYGRVISYGLEYNFPSLEPYIEYFIFASHMTFFYDLFILRVRNNDFNINMYLSNINNELKLEVRTTHNDITTSITKKINGNGIGLDLIDKEVLDVFLTYLLDKRTLETYEMTSPLTDENKEMLKLLHY